MTIKERTVTSFITGSMIRMALQCVNQMEVGLHHHSVCISVQIDIFSIFHRKEGGHPLKIYEPLLMRNHKLLVGCLFQNQVGKADPHILLTECTEHTFFNF